MRILIPVLALVACVAPETESIPGPGEPGYDPVTYRLAGNLSMRDVVWGEPRDGEWANTRERALAGVLPAPPDLVRCRTSSCVLVVWVPSDEADDVMAAIPRIGPMTGVRITGVDAAQTRLEIYALFPPWLRPHDAYADWLNGARPDVVR